jgi:two-component system chemotaxis response regulator CheB
VQKVLSSLPGNFPAPILIAQHMPAAFTGPFAARLDGLCALTVKEAEPVERVKSGHVYICPGGKHLRLENRGGTLTAVVTEEPKTALYKPSANVLMETAGLALGARALCVMLTGMGNDGLEGAKILKAKGGWAIAQNEASCVVYGMPKAIVDANLADEIVDIGDMAETILAHFSSRE